MAERVSLEKDKSNGHAEPFDFGPAPNTEDKPPVAAPAPEAQQSVSLAHVNGRLSALSEVNQWLTGQLAIAKGQLADKDVEIARLTQELIVERQSKRPNALQDKRSGHRK